MAQIVLQEPKCLEARLLTLIQAKTKPNSNHSRMSATFKFIIEQIDSSQRRRQRTSNFII